MTRLRHGFVVWLTGLPAAGKTTLAHLLAEKLLQKEIPAEVLDGDVLRACLSKDLGFSKKDRDINVRRIGYLCDALSRKSVVAIAAAISPYRAVRNEIRTLCQGRFIEVYLQCTLPVLIQRDPKGLYKRALAGEIPDFTGISAPYEVPLEPEILLNTDQETPEESCHNLMAKLEDLGYL